jgi:hypothetical protein
MIPSEILTKAARIRKRVAVMTIGKMSMRIYR